MSPSTDVKLRETILSFRVQRVGCNSLESAKRFVLFALRAIREGSGYVSPLLSRYPVLAEVLRRAERWVGSGKLDDFSEASNDQLWAARKELKIFMAPMVGERAVAGAISQLDDAMDKYALVEGDPVWLNEVAANCGLAAYLMRRSDEQGLSPTAVAFQEQLFQEVFGN